MKHRTLRLAASAALLCFVAVGCSKSKSTDHAAQNKPSNSSEPAVELKVKWTPGKKVTQRMTISSAIHAGAPKNGQNIQQTTDMSWDYSLNPLKTLDNGGHEVELEFVATKFEMKVGDRVYMSFDSAHDDGKQAKDPITPALRKLIGGKMRYTLGPDNKIERVDGYDDFMVRIARGSDSRNTEMLKGMFSEDMLKRLCSSADLLPDHPVRPGDSWKNSMDMTIYGTAKMTINGTFTFANWEDHNGHKCVKLDYEGKIVGKGSGAGAPMSIDKGTIHGSSWFDPEQGVAVATDNDQTMTVSFQQRGTSQQMTQNVTIKLIE
jgi:hypothetical protein